MRVLIISDVAWDERNSYGNTLSNWFGGWNNVEIFNIYCRASLPRNSICKHYYSVPPLSLMKNIFWPSRTGKRIENLDFNCLSDSDNQEQQLIQKAQKGKKEWMYLLSDLAYSTGVWKSQAYGQFISEANPDIVFSFGIADAFIYENYRYIKANTSAKIVTFVADDVYGAYLDRSKLRSKLQAKRFRKIIKMTDLLYGASETMCNEYQKIFKKTMKPLYKGCSFAPIKEATNIPLRFVYAGNLLWGRADILGILAEELVQINKNGLKAVLDISTGSFLTPEIKTKLNRGESSKIVGERPYEEVVKAMNKADIVLHVESFDPTSIKTVRYSFSTKIIDCLQSGTAMMVIGPEGIASVEYPKQIPGAIVVDNIQKIKQSLEILVSNPSVLKENARLINAFAKDFHSIEFVRKSLIDDFVKLRSANL